MSLFDRIFGTKKKDLPLTTFRTLTAYQPAFRSFSGSLYESDLIRSAIDSRARHIQKLKVEFIGRERSLFTYLKNQPNEFQTWSQFLYRLSTILDMQNTAFIVPFRDKFGDKIIGIYPILPSRCEVAEYKGELYLRYEFSNGDRGAIEFNKCAVMTKFQYKDDMFGEKNTALKPTMELVSIKNQGIKEAVVNGATYRFYAKVNNFAKDEDLKKERQRFNEQNFKAENGSGGVLLFPNTYTEIHPIESKPYTINPEEIKQIQTNVYNYFGTNEDILQNKAIGDKWSAFYEGAIEPFAVQFSEVMTKLLFTNQEQNTGNKVIATANRLQYMSAQDKLNVSSQMLDRGILSINEVREIWNMPEVENGDKHVIRGEYYDLNAKVGENDSVSDDNSQSDEEQPKDTNNENKGENENAN